LRRKNQIYGVILPAPRNDRQNGTLSGKTIHYLNEH
jgi:hypothetical protein